ncbi:MAG: ATP-dependent DNA helicase RecG, partial [Flavisolibacter sp.]
MFARNGFISSSPNILANPIEYLKGVGPLRGDMLKKELGIFTFYDLLHHFPYRHLDKTRITPIAGLTAATDYALVQGRLLYYEMSGSGSSKRITATLKDSSGVMELTWFKALHWVEKLLKQDEIFLAYGRIGFFMGKPQIVHPELELASQETANGKNFLEPVYPSTEKLKTKNLGGRQLGKLTAALFALLTERDIPENLPAGMLSKLRLMPRFEAYRQIHFPSSPAHYDQALRRLKFEELFITQLRLAMVRSERHRKSKGVVFQKVGDLFNQFYSEYLPFELTGAQKRVIKEIRMDTGSGHQMNRLLQGDVGSGKTMVALLAMLLALDNGYQCCLMAPTEILAQQHFITLTEMLRDLPVRMHLLTGSTPARNRKQILKELAEGTAGIVTGTHALIEEVVQFKNLGIAVIDEQHRFGVAQRARLWKKGS